MENQMLKQNREEIEQEYKKIDFETNDWRKNE